MSGIAGMKDMDHSAIPGMEHDAMPGVDHGAMPGMKSDAMPGMNAPGPAATSGKAPEKAMAVDMGAKKGAGPEAQSAMGAMGAMGAMQGGPAPADARDPDAYADGLQMGSMPGMDMADDHLYGQLLIDRLEATHSSDDHGQALDAQAWFGGDLNKLWLKVDGERSNGKLGATRTEALWNRAIAPYWGVQTGLRHDFGGGPGRNWAALGVQGLAPWWFDVQATAYIGPNGRTAAHLEGEYDLLITQRLVLQPNVKLDAYGKSDREREIGSGFSNVEAGLRLRYEFTRKFAPYVGVVWNSRLGRTADYARETGTNVRETKLVAGVRFWF